MIILDTNVLSALMRDEPDRRASIATRNLRQFAGLSVPVVSPWGEESAPSA